MSAVTAASARWVALRSFSAAGVNLLLLQCSPQFEEMERFADAIISATPLSRWKR